MKNSLHSDSLYSKLSNFWDQNIEKNEKINDIISVIDLIFSLVSMIILIAMGQLC